MKPQNATAVALVLLLFLSSIPRTIADASAQTKSGSTDAVPLPSLLRIMRAEDQRRWDNELKELLQNQNAAVRARALLATGRIGDSTSVDSVAKLLIADSDEDVRAMAAFALGEIEADSGSDSLLTVVRDPQTSAQIRARSVEALGKIADALPKEKDVRLHQLGAAILDVLKFENARKATADTQTILLGLTAVLRARPADAGPTLIPFLGYETPRIKADTENTLARLRLKDANPQIKSILATDSDAVVRANAARVLGATNDKSAFDLLLDHSINDSDARVRVSAIRALGSLKDSRAKSALLERASSLLKLYLERQSRVPGSSPSEKNEMLEIASALSRLTPSPTEDELGWVLKYREVSGATDPEVEIALARMAPQLYLNLLANGGDARQSVQRTILLNWRAAASVAQGLGEIATLPAVVRKQFGPHAVTLLRALLEYRNSGLHIATLVAVHSEYAIPEVLRAFAAFKPPDLPAVLRAHLNEHDVIVRATAADLLGELPASEETVSSLVRAWPRTRTDKLNDAALSILDSLSKQKTRVAFALLKSALDSNDYLVRRRAADLLKSSEVGDFAAKIGTVTSRNAAADYRRAVARMGKPLFAVVTTSKGSFTIELLPDEAPLTVDNFVHLATSGYFGNVTIHRVVPNFVIQDGDPRGDGNGGPGYQIRCEINEVPYDRAAVGMALSGKDTGGSQWFVTHSPQPHLDGGYTVFGRVTNGMDVVDNIVRGDTIESIAIQNRP